VNNGTIEPQLKAKAAIRETAPPRPALLRRHSVNAGDRAYPIVLRLLALLVPLMMLAVAAQLAVGAWPALKRFGPAFMWTSTWDPVAEVYGAAPMIFGTVVSSLLALVIAVRWPWAPPSS
jgi:phosphate transport system permease protein